MSGSYGYPEPGPENYSYPTGQPTPGAPQPQNLSGPVLNNRGQITVGDKRVACANWGWRLISGLVDYGPAYLLYSLLSRVGDPQFTPGVGYTGGGALNSTFDALAWIVFLAIVLANSGYLQGMTGQSLGKRLVGTQLVRGIKTPEGDAYLALPGAPVSSMRVLLHAVDALPCFLGFFAPLLTFYYQTWSDKLAKTVVIRTKVDYDLPFAPPGSRSTGF